MDFKLFRFALFLFQLNSNLFNIFLLSDFFTENGVI